jgi:hypothetical protein
MSAVLRHRNGGRFSSCRRYNVVKSKPKIKKGKKNTVVEERGERGRMHSTNRSVFFFLKKKEALALR